MHASKQSQRRLGQGFALRGRPAPRRVTKKLSVDSSTDHHCACNGPRIESFPGIDGQGADPPLRTPRLNSLRPARVAHPQRAPSEARTCRAELPRAALEDGRARGNRSRGLPSHTADDRLIPLSMRLVVVGQSRLVQGLRPRFTPSEPSTGRACFPCMVGILAVHDELCSVCFWEATLTRRTPPSSSEPTATR